MIFQRREERYLFDFLFNDFLKGGGGGGVCLIRGKGFRRDDRVLFIHNIWMCCRKRVNDKQQNIR